MNQDIEQFVHNLNTTWQQGNVDELTRFYHAEVVLLPPDAGEPIVGRRAVIDSYREFSTAATLHEFTINSLDVFDFKTTAVVHMRFVVEFSLGEQRLREGGLEVYLLDLINTEPVIVWRSQNILDSREITSG